MFSVMTSFSATPAELFCLCFALLLCCLMAQLCQSGTTALLHAISILLSTAPLLSGHARRTYLTGRMNDFHAEIAAHQALIPENGNPSL